MRLSTDGAKGILFRRMKNKIIVKTIWGNTFCHSQSKASNKYGHINYLNRCNRGGKKIGVHNGSAHFIYLSKE